MKKILFIILGILIIIISIVIWNKLSAQCSKIETIKRVTEKNTSIILGLELPCDTTNIIRHKAYSFVYNEEHEQANWVAYQLIKTELIGDSKRANKFMEDPSVTTATATNADYQKSGYDRGNLAPAADMKWNKIAMDESFYFSNMSPQKPEFNRGIWKQLEEQVRNWAVTYDTIYVVTGPILHNNLPTIGTNKVSVPEYYFKAILVYTHTSKKAIGFIMPNKKCTDSIFSYAISINEIEKQLQTDLFCKLPNEIENLIESNVDKSAWR